MNIIIFGCGMYVAGSKHKSESPVLSAVTQFTIDNQEAIILCFVLPSEESISRNKQKLEENLVYKYLKESRFLIQTQFILDQDLEDYLSKQSNSSTAALVCSPDYKHLNHSHKCLDRGINTLIMKPAVCNLDEFKKLKEHLKKSDGKCFIEHHKRFDPQIKTLKKLINNTEDLKVQDIVVEYGQPYIVANEIFKRWNSVSDPFTYIGCHYIDLITYLFKAKISSINIFSSKVSELIKFKRNADCVQVVIKWSSYKCGDFISYVSCNWIEPTGSDAVSRQTMNILTNKWRIELDQKCRGIKFTKDIGKQINPHYIHESLNEDNFEATGYAIESIKGFIEYSLYGKSSFESFACSLEQNHATIEAIEYVRNSFIK